MGVYEASARICRVGCTRRTNRYLSAYPFSVQRIVHADLPGRKADRGISCRVPTTLGRCTCRVVTSLLAQERTAYGTVLSKSLGAFLGTACSSLQRGVASIVRHCSEGTMLGTCRGNCGQNSMHRLYEGT